MATSHYFIGGGVAHSQEMVRRDMYASMAGAEGIVEPKHLLVRPLATTGGGVRVAIGSAYMKSLYSGAFDELYMGSVTSEETVNVPANNGGSNRYDLVVMRVKDPYANGSPWPKPDAGITDPEAAEVARDAAQYVSVELVTGVSSGVRSLQSVPLYANDTAVTLARITMRPGTSVLVDDIMDLREVARPRRDEFVFARPRIGADESSGSQYLTGKQSNGGEFFPGGSGTPNQFTAKIPTWATHMAIDARWMSVMLKGNPFGNFWVEFGDEYRDHTWPDKKQYEFATQVFGFNAANTGNEVKSTNFLLMDQVPVPAKLRGKQVTFVFKASRRDETQINASHQVSMAWDSGLGCRLTYAQAALGPDSL